MKRQYLSPTFSIIAMVLLIISRLLSDKGFDWLAMAAAIIIFIGLIGVYLEYRKSK